MKPIMHALVGTWFICSTNFPMWLKGDKINPTFTYSLTTKNGNPNVLLDEVTYQKKGKTKTLTGFDYPDPKNASAFVWRGKGVLSLLRSRWSVVLQDPNGQWTVIQFSKTLFTPEGIDIISRTPQLPPKTLDYIKAQIANKPELTSHLATMHELAIR